MFRLLHDTEGAFLYCLAEEYREKETVRGIDFSASICGGQCAGCLGECFDESK